MRPAPRATAAIAGVLLGLNGCIFLQRPVSSPGAAHPDHALAIERGRNIVRPLVRRGSGVAVAVGVDGQLVWSEGFGRVAQSRGAHVTPQAGFRIYSLIKQVTAVAALDAARRGEVDLRASIRRVIPSLPEHYEQVTLRHLLTHTAGVRHYRDSAEARLTKHCSSAAEALPLFVPDPLSGQPGTAQSYSTWGFVLASAILERAAGKPFDAFMRERVFLPAAMSSARLERSARDSNALVFFDVDRDGVLRQTPPLDNSCKMGGGGFLASAEDLVHFHNAVLRGELVPLAAVRQLLGNRSFLAAAGTGPGGEAVSHVDLDSRISVVVLSNTGGLEQRIALDRARALLMAVFEGGR